MATPPDFVAGNVLTAAQMNAVGMWLVKKQTIGSTVSSVTVSDAFSADYENYRILISGGVASVSPFLALTFGSTNTGYYSTLTYGEYVNNLTTSLGSANVASFAYAGAGNPNGLLMDVAVSSPFLAKLTSIQTRFVGLSTTGAGGTFGGFINNTTSYTAFTVTPNSGTMTGGTIYVYGMRI